MGANATTFVPAYVAGEVLTAADLSVTNSGIPVFATTTTRDAAFGGTGEKTLAEGQFAYIEASNTTQYYDGTAWQTVGGGFAIVQPETAVTASTTITLDGCFTSSYTNYRINLNLTGASAASVLFQLRASGSTASGTNYCRQYIDATNTTISAGRTTGDTSVNIGIADNDFRSTFILEVFQPQLAQYTNFYAQNIYSSGTSTTNLLWYQSTGIHNLTTAYDGFLITGTAALTGTYSVYGYGK